MKDIDDEIEWDAEALRGCLFSILASVPIWLAILLVITRFTQLYFY